MDLVRDFIDCNRDMFVTLSDDELKKLHQILHEMLEDLIHFCNEKGIVYFISGGTALGAVRGGTFIPWDDDIDIAMPYDGFDILRREYEAYYKGRYIVEAPNSKRKGSFAFMKIKRKGTCLRELMEQGPEYGVFIDVFPIVYASDSSIIRFFAAQYSFIWQGISYAILFSKQYSIMKQGIKNCGISKRIAIKLSVFLGRLLGIIPQEKWLDIFDRTMRKNKGKYLVIPTGLHGYKKECFDYDVYFPARQIIFDGLVVMAPNKIEKILETFYGDYMKPPKDKSHHFFLETNLENNY